MRTPERVSGSRPVAARGELGGRGVRRPLGPPDGFRAPAGGQLLESAEIVSRPPSVEELLASDCW
jgi:hypothetical protein